MHPLDRVAEVFEFRRSLTPETDRGCALMAAAYLDAETRGTLKFKGCESLSMLHKRRVGVY